MARRIRTTPALAVAALLAGCGASARTIVRTTEVHTRSTAPRLLPDLEEEETVWDAITIVRKAGAAVELTKGRVGLVAGMVVVTRSWTSQPVATFSPDEVAVVRTALTREAR